ncbi:MAG: nitroreductase family protein [Lachnospiraceae bacterium]|nr:nitroreductase family protein [Lachnospiraceae bacterium]
MERGKTLYDIQNTAAAVQNILLSATDMGLGSCWCGDFDESGLQEIFQMDSGSGRHHYCNY